jgi:hypothetical protein
MDRDEDQVCLCWNGWPRSRASDASPRRTSWRRRVST